MGGSALLSNAIYIMFVIDGGFVNNLHSDCKLNEY